MAKSEYQPRLINKYKEDVVPALQKKFGYKNAMQVPKLQKITINIGTGDATQDARFLEGAVSDLTAITGQKPVVTKAKKAISNFKLRIGMPIGCMVTLRKDIMYEFLDRLLNIALPRVRDFRGVGNNGFDGKGNFTLGIREQIIFPEISYDKVVKIRGMNITFVTTAKTDEEAFELLAQFGMPFQKKDA